VSEYDAIAGLYDSLYRDPESLAEDARVIEHLNDRELLSGSVLDVGCGTGLLLDYCPRIAPYVGIDPSAGMLAEARVKHPDNVFEQATLGNFEGGCFDAAISLYGSLSYAPLAEVRRLRSVLAEGGRYFVMLFAPGYEPQRMIDLGVNPEHHNAEALNVLDPYEEFRVGNFVVAVGDR
jgi:SAM-dependent methyltransferase